jgi:hypothetical protein
MSTVTVTGINEYTVEVGGQTFTTAQWNAIQDYIDGRFAEAMAETNDSVKGLREDVDKAISLLASISENVKPALDALESSMIGKMFGLGKKD